jgi:aspartyl-tRNA(Asn)/glutamyl-tRNA(Gln) amidotransferase subunit A
MAEASRLIRACKLSPVELCGDGRDRGRRLRGPLHGMPYALKDIFDVAGLATTCHSKLRMNHRAAADAAVVARLRAAGAVLLGKLALHEFANGGPTRELPWPPALNPWDLDRHPGGSSSGSGVAVATGLAPGALGTDTGGSVRNPATCCGVIGMKPTYGVVSRTGVFPLSFSLDHVGPLTRTVEDNAMLLGAIVGHDPADRSCTTRALGDCLTDLHAGGKGLRIGVIAHFYTEDLIGAPEQVTAIAAAADVLRRLGAQVRPVRLSSLARLTDCGRTILFSEAYAVHQRDLEQRPEDYAEATRRKLLPGAFIPASDYVKSQQLRTLLCREFVETMKDFDAVSTLSSLDLPCRIDDSEAVARTYERQCRMPFNVTGTPAISVPTGFTSTGLPLAMQIAGRAFAEPMVYRIAQAYCDATRFGERHPPAVQPAEAMLA